MVGSLSDLEGVVAARLPAPGTGVVGVGGPVAVGKSTVAEALARGLDGAVVSTDAFLLPNDVLAERGLIHRKGFPETYDARSLVEVLEGARAGRWPLTTPVYSHETYDVVSGASHVVEESPVLIVDGVVALQAPVAEVLDVGVYIHAEEEHVRSWFVERFQRFVESADEGSFYRAFAGMEPSQVRAVAEGTWDGINGVNLREHIERSMLNATVVVRKGASHQVLAIEVS